MGSSVFNCIHGIIFLFPKRFEWRQVLRRSLMQLVMLAMFLLMQESRTPAFAEDFVHSRVEIKHPQYDIELFSGPGSQDPISRVVKSEEFPETVQYFGTSTVAGRMHHIRFDGDPNDYWVAGDRVLIKAESSKVKITCDASQSTAMGNVGRGVGSEVVCNN